MEHNRQTRGEKASTYIKEGTQFVWALQTPPSGGGGKGSCINVLSARTLLTSGASDTKCGEQTIPRSVRKKKAAGARHTMFPPNILEHSPKATTKKASFPRGYQKRRRFFVKCLTARSLYLGEGRTPLLEGGNPLECILCV